MTMEIHVHSTLALRKQKEKKGKVTHPTIAQTNKRTCIIYIYIYIVRDTWMPSLENWGGAHVARDTWMPSLENWGGAHVAIGTPGCPALRTGAVHM